MTKFYAVRNLLLVMFLGMMGVKGWGQVVNQDFTSGTVGNAVTATPISWATNGGGNGTFTIANTTPITYSGYNSVGGNYLAVSKSTSNTSNVSTPSFGQTAATSSTFYFSFLLNVPTITAGTDYFASLSTTSSSGSYFGRVFIKSVTNGTVGTGTYNIGLSKANGTGNYKTSATALTAGTTYLIVVRYTYNNGTSTDDASYLWINPIISSEPTTASAEVNDLTGNDATLLNNNGVFTLKNSTATQSYSIDGIRVAYGTTTALAWSSLSAAAVPTAPTITSITSGNQQLSVNFTAPSSDGGSAITSYKYSTDGGTTFRSRASGTTASPLVISTLSADGTTTLTNGTSYNIQIKAVTANGDGAATASTAATPYTVAGAPTSVSAVAGNTQATISFTAPVSNGGSTITGYTVTSSPDGLTSSGSASPITVIGLTNGTAYTFSVVAINAGGNSAASSPSNSITPNSGPTIPGTPVIGAATAGNNQAIVAFTAPSSDGGSAITSYTATSTPGNFTGTINQSGSGSITVAGLTNGTAYTFTVYATNNTGNSLLSSSSNSVTPATTPAAPTITGITPGNGQLSVAFTAPASNGAAITNYKYSINGGTTFTAVSPAQTTSPIVITGLTNGTSYSIQLLAVNSVGDGAASGTTTATPVTTPGAPSITSITPGNGQLSVAFTAPSSNGGSAITNYKYSTNGGSSFTTVSPASTNSPIIITGLTNGTAYNVQIRAVNAQGDGTATASTSATPVTTPSAPTITSITPGTNSLSVAFTAGNNGGSAITNYKYSIDGGSTFTAVSPAQTTSPIVISGLTNGTTYQVQIKAVNAVGDGAASASASGTPALTYCVSTGNQTSDGITNVTFNTINNTSGQTKYSDYTSTQSTNVLIGNSYNLSVKINTGGNYTNYVKVWIDWNHDGAFNTTTEEFDLGSATNVSGVNSSLSPLSITVPSGYIGVTRIRVSTQYNVAPTACNASFDGEVEDYAITILANNLPTLTTTAISNPTVNSASSGGNITADGGSSVTSRGVVWSTSTAPTIALTTKTSDGTGTGPYTSSLTGLADNKTYYVRAYATNANGTSYGNEVSFTTLSVAAPTATAATAISSTGFTTNWSAVTGATSYRLDVLTTLSFSEDFTDGNITASPSWSNATDYSYLTASSLPAGLAATDGTYIGSNSSVGNSASMISSPEVNEWNFSLASTTYNPSTANYFGVILMSNTLASSISTSFNGYYLKVGNTNNNNFVELWKSTGTIKTFLGSFNTADYTTGALQDGLNIRITRNVSGTFQLYYGTGFTFSSTPTTSAGTLTDNTYTSSNYFGLFTNFANPGTSRRIYLDNIILSTTGTYVTNFQDVSVNSISQPVNGLSSNTTYYYRVRAVGANSTSGNSGTITVTTANSLGGTASPINVTCNGAANGSIAISATGGSGTYQYKLGSGTAQDQNVFSSLAPGTYSVTITDKNDAAATPFVINNITITQPAALTINISAAASAVCSGSGTTINFTGGPSSGSVVYAINNVSQPAVTLTSGSASVSTGALTSNTTYSLVSVSDGTCSNSVSGSATVTVNPLPTATISGTTSVCQNTTAPNITFTGSNGTAPYTFTYNINGGSNQTITSGSGTNPVSVTVAAPTTTTGTFTYNLVSVAGQFCSQAQSGSAVVTVSAYPATPTITAGGPTTFCTGGSVVLTSSSSTDNQWYKDGVSIGGATYQTYTATASGDYTVSVTNAGGCSSTSAAKSVTLTSTNTWIGLSTVWTDGNNWCTGTPPSGSTNAIISSDAPNYPVLVADAAVNDLQIKPGAKITIGANTFTINGDVTGAGMLVGSSTSNLVIGGSGGTGNLYFDQTTDNTTNVLNSLTVNRSSGNIAIANKLNLLSVLTVTTGTLSSGGNLVLRSTDIDKTARVATVGSNGFITGDVVSERFIPATARAYRFISPSVTTGTSIRQNWMENQNNPSTTQNLNSKPGYGTHITGNAGDAGGFDVTQNNSPSLFGYNNITEVWSNVTSTSGNLTAGVPLRLFVRGDRGISLASNTPTPTNTILRATGALRTGTIVYNSTSTPAIIYRGNALSYDFVGNPYASPVDWNQLAKNNVGPTYWCWDPHIGGKGVYVSYNGANGHTNFDQDSKVNSNLQPGQAFFVEVKGSSPSLEFEETDKTSVFTAVFRTPGSEPVISANLFYNDTSGTRILADGVTAIFDDSFSKWVSDEDSYKFTNNDENLCINHEDTMLSIEGRPISGATDTLKLKLWQYRQKSYVFKVNVKNFPAGTTAVMKDAYLNKETLLSITDSTLVPFSLTTDSASFAPDRFIIVFKPGSVLPVTVTDVKAYQKEKGIQVDWISRTETNISRYEVEKSLNGRDFAKAGSVEATGNNTAVTSYGWFDATPAEGNNFYRVKVIEKSGALKYTQIVKVTIGKANSSMTVYPNPVKGSTISLHMTNMEKGKYTATLYNNLGQKMMSKQIEHIGGSANYSMYTGKVMPKGTYRLTATNGETEMTATVVFE